MIIEKLKRIEEGEWKGWYQYGGNLLSPQLYREVTNVYK